MHICFEECDDITAKIERYSQFEFIGRDALIGVDELTTGFSDIGGMKEQLDDVVDNIVLPMQIFNSLKGEHDIAPCPTGVLLYGRPGICISRYWTYLPYIQLRYVPHVILSQKSIT